MKLSSRIEPGLVLNPSDLVRPGQGKRVFAIGDVHGQDDAFEHVLDAMAEAAEESKEETELVLLGDLIDRGPGPTRCLDLAMKSAEELGFDGKTVLMGNHEQMARLALGLPDHFFGSGCRAVATRFVARPGLQPRK